MWVMLRKVCEDEVNMSACVGRRVMKDVHDLCDMCDMCVKCVLCVSCGV